MHASVLPELLKCMQDVIVMTMLLDLDWISDWQRE